MQIWPAIDLRGGKCVRLRQGDYNQETVFGEDPVATASQWVEHGAEFLHLVDLDGARDGQPTNHEVIRQIVAAASVPCQVGGGIRSQETIESLLNGGVSRLIIGTRAIKEPEWFRAMCREFTNRLALGIDARDGWVATDGWLETSGMAATDLVSEFADEPIDAVIYTDIAQDGMMSGPNFEAMAEMKQTSRFPIIASGGVTTVADVRQLAQSGLDGCIIGRSLYEGKINLRAALEAARSHHSPSE